MQPAHRSLPNRPVSRRATRLFGTQFPGSVRFIAAQNALFEEWYQADLRAHPERATEYGDYRYNDRLDGRSLAALSAEHASDQEFIAHLKAIPTAGFPEQD